MPKQQKSKSASQAQPEPKKDDRLVLKVAQSAFDRLIAALEFKANYEADTGDRDLANRLEQQADIQRGVFAPHTLTKCEYCDYSPTCLDQCPFCDVPPKLCSECFHAHVQAEIKG